MSKLTNLPSNLRSSSLTNLSKSALTRKGDIAGEIMYVDPDDCYVVLNPRKTMNLELVEAYTAEFLDPEQGQREACTVYPKDEKGYRIHHGATRTCAGQKAKKINPEWKLKVQIDPKLSARSDFKNFWEQGSNNINRDNMTIFDQADWMASCIELAEAEGEKLSQAEIARRLVMSKAQVSRILSLHQATLKVREVYESGRTTDPETLSNLVKLNKSNPELFNELISTTELDRSTVREAVKSGKLPVVSASPESPTSQNIHSQGNAASDDQQDEVQSTEGSTEYFVAHAQQNPLDGIELSTGECFILMLKSEKGYKAAATTSFEHEFNLTVPDNQMNFWGDKEAAIKQAQQNLYQWTFKVEKNKAEISDEQLTDALLIRDWYSIHNSEKDVNTEQNAKKTPGNGAAKAKKTVVTAGTWNGQDCVLVTRLDSKTLIEMGNIIEEAETEGLVYILLGTNEYKKIQPEEFHLKSVKFID